VDWNSSTARAQRLSQLETLDALTKKDIARLIKAGTSIRIGAGDALVREGEQGPGVYLVVAGELDVHQGDERIGTMRAGDLIGEISMLERTPATATLTATSECEALLIQYDEVRRLVDDVPAFRTAVLATAHDRLQRDRHRE
jgi:CRP/FNR family cyclic AMP-dependent transcriptional regulator